MTISSQMQLKIDRIEALIQDGYTLSKTSLGFIDFRNSSGKPVNIIGGFKSSPAGFSWAGFFFPFVVCAQIKEWSYFYVVGSFWVIMAIIEGLTQLPISSNSSAGIPISMLYGYMLPYLRKMAKDNGTVDAPVWLSIFIGSLFSIVCMIPAVIIDNLFGTI